MEVTAPTFLSFLLNEQAEKIILKKMNKLELAIKLRDYSTKMNSTSGNPYLPIAFNGGKLLERG